MVVSCSVFGRLIIELFLKLGHCMSSVLYFLFVKVWIFYGEFDGLLGFLSVSDHTTNHLICYTHNYMCLHLWFGFNLFVYIVLIFLCFWETKLFERNEFLLTGFNVFGTFETLSF